MNLYERAFFKTADFFRGRTTINKLDFLRSSQYWTKEEMVAWQLRRLNELLIKARNSTLFYKERLRDINLPLESINDLQRVPILTKQNISANMERIKCFDEYEKLFVPGKTGGSTGEPTRFFRDKRGLDWNRASVYRSAEWAGLRLGEYWAQMTGSHYDYSRNQQFYWKLQFFLLRYIDFPIAFVNDDIYEHYFVMLNKYRPTSIWGYSSGVYNFALFIERKHPGKSLDFIKALITSSETLYDYQRKKINEVFGKDKVYDNYGSREFYIAAECAKHDGYHMHSEVVLVEIVDNEGRNINPGEIGRVLITDLSNRVFPFIRYEIGDVAVKAPEGNCGCGLTLPRLSRVEGRVADMIVLEDGILTPPNFTIFMSDSRGVEQYQIIQKSIRLIELNIVRNSEFNPDTEKYILKCFEKLIRDKARVKINYVDKIEVPKSGKRRFVISEVAKDKL